MCEYPIDLDLKDVDTVAVDIETYDPNLKTKGWGAIRGDGFKLYAEFTLLSIGATSSFPLIAIKDTPTFNSSK